MEGKWKAIELGQIKKDAPYYEAVYANRLASNLKVLGYGIERKGKSFEIAGVSRDMIDKFSRRSAYINRVADKLGIKNPETKAKLGATTRLGKAKELADDLQGYYRIRLTEAEKRQLATLEGRPSREVSVQDSVSYSLGHHFERQSVVDERRLYETAIRFGIGCVTPEGVREEALKQGLMVKDRSATTKAVLAEEMKILAFARDGRGTCRTMGAAGRGTSPPDATPQHPQQDDTATPVPLPQAGTRSNNDHVRETWSKNGETGTRTALSPEQAVMVNHMLTSTDRVILTVGDAGTGKTFAVRQAFQQIDRPIDILAPSADASRGVLRREGFTAADTVSAFLGDRNRQAAVKNGVIWIDEAGLLPIRDLSRLVDVAKSQNARLVLQGDPKQHRSVARDGNMLRVLETHAGLPVARLTDIRRQKGQYKQAVADIAAGKLTAGFDALIDLGWVKQADTAAPMVADYLAAVDAGKEVLAVAPTHAEAAEVTAAIRASLKARGELGEERQVPTLTPLHWSEAERGDLERFTGTEVIQFHRNGGTFKAGDRVAVAAFKPGQKIGPASTFAVYAPAELPLAVGDRVRVTANGYTADKKHRLDNGSHYTVAGFEQDGRIKLTNGWHVAPDFGHLAHGYVSTSHASQGKTVDRVLIAMGRQSLPAVNREQFYVSVSRGREQATVYSDLPPDELRANIQRADGRQAAVEVFHRRERSRLQRLLQRGRDYARRLRERAGHDSQEREKVRYRTYGR